MTVKQLIQKLQKYPPNKEVDTYRIKFVEDFKGEYKRKGECKK